MKSNICWSTKYYVQIKEYQVCVVYNNEKNPTPWEVYILTKGGEGLQLLIDTLRKGGVEFYISDNKVILTIKSEIEDENTFIGGCLPPIYEELLNKLEKVVYEITRESNEEN